MGGGGGGQTLQWLRTQKLRISLYEYIGGGGQNPAVTTDAEVTDFPLWIYSFQRFSLFILEKIRIRPCIHSTCCQQLSRSKNKNKLLMLLNLFFLQTLFSLKVNSESDPLLVIGWNVFFLLYFLSRDMRSDKLRKAIWIRHKRVKYRHCLLLKMSIINHFDLIVYCMYCVLNWESKFQLWFVERFAID